LSSKKSLTEQSLSQSLSKDQGNSAVFVKLYEADKNRLYAYIYAFVLDHAAADDIFQETSLTLWREFARFEVGTSFSKWANGIAFNRIRNVMRVNNKYLLDIDDNLLEEFYQNSVEDSMQAQEQNDKWWHLQHCTSLLSGSLKNIYHSFYIDNFKAKEIAEQTGRSIHGIRKSVHKLRKSLFDCIESRLQQVKNETK
jgi:RNA polymerase sigma-70 factor (ECF subfamily)